MANHCDNDFFFLLRAGLWHKTDGTLSSNPDWNGIYDLAVKQTVAGFIAEGITQLNLAGTLTDSQQNLFSTAVADIVSRNFEIGSKQSEICALLDKEKLKFYIVKGQEAGRNYLNPMMRTAGDIDILLGEDDYRKARTILAPVADSAGGEYEYALHKGYFFGDIEVELHGCLHPNLGDRIDAVLDKTQEDLFKSEINVQTFNAFYLFIHCLQHIFFEGLGLRQIADWAVLLSGSESRIDFSRVTSDIEKAGLKYEWDVFCFFAKKYLGGQSVAFSACEDQDSRISSGAEALWRVCRRKGNMGHFSDTKITTEQFWLRKIQKLRRTFTNYFGTRKISPELSLLLLKRDLAKYARLY